jgi:hypothetical protein
MARRTFFSYGVTRGGKGFPLKKMRDGNLAPAPARWESRTSTSEKGISHQHQRDGNLAPAPARWESRTSTSEKGISHQHLRDGNLAPAPARRESRTSTSETGISHQHQRDGNLAPASSKTADRDVGRYKPGHSGWPQRAGSWWSVASCRLTYRWFSGQSENRNLMMAQMAATPSFQVIFFPSS